MPKVAIKPTDRVREPRGCHPACFAVRKSGASLKVCPPQSGEI
jgi:hypothetical protein